MMDTAAEQAEKLRQQIAQTEKELESLRSQLAALEPEPETVAASAGSAGAEPEPPPTNWPWPLAADEYARYGRQLVLPQIGLRGQRRLKASAVLIVGCGGLGCPAAAYLCGAGVGTLGLADGDVVEASNLHRQIAHGGGFVGRPKTESLAAFCGGLNPRVRTVRHGAHLTPANAAAVVRAYDLVLDCTDHPAVRYLLSDVCVLLRKPLVSASALRTDGQLIVLNQPPAKQGDANGGPCYRCVFPAPPPAESVVSCGEGGILGPVVGVMGVLQALEAIKLIAAGKEPTSSPSPSPPSLLLFSATSSPPFRSIRMRGRRANCAACSAGSTLTLEQLTSGSLDYVAFCGVTAPINLLQPEERISASAYKNIMAEVPSKKSLLLDVREKELFEIGSIPGAINVPYSTLQARSRTAANGDGAQPNWLPEDVTPDASIYVVCRVGNDSQVVTKKLKDLGLDRGGERFIGDIEGGMKAWKHEVDNTMPFL
ncbi:adenylyltransferase [Xylariomycetidae sp. FL0641]|nr:adenylyltransferase [Xylariomycetidae sp. FL0641]